MGIFTAFSVFISLILTNSYIATVLPMIIYVLTSAVDLPILINPHRIYSGNNYIIHILARSNEDNFSPLAMLYPFIFAAMLLTVLSFASFSVIAKKYEANSDLR